MKPGLATTALVLVALGCSQPSSRSWFTVNLAPNDGRSLPAGATPTLVFSCGACGRQSLPVDAVTLVEWPEGTAVAQSTTREPFPADAPSEMAAALVIRPADPLEPRWYAVRWTPVVLEAEEEVEGGIPLVGGDRLWRFYGASAPEATQLVASETGGAILEFSERVGVLESGVAPDDVVQLTQDGRSCATRLWRDGAFLWQVELTCSPALDPAAEARLVIRQGLGSASGEPVPAVDVSFTIASQMFAGLVFPSRLTPPPVPPEL